MLKNYEIWKNANLPENLKNELNSLTQDEIFDAFYKELSFGTAGLRGLIGVGTNRINEVVVKKITKGYANYLNKNFKNPSIAISYDNRLFSKEFAYTAAKVLAANNIKTYIFNELRPTPMLSFLTRYYNCSGGIMITASHNPKEYNGYKLYESYGGQLNLENSEKVSQEITKINDIFNIEEAENHLINWVDVDEFDNIYLKEVKAISLNDFEDKATILYSPLHGTGGKVISKMFNTLGYNYYSYEPHMNPDPYFSNTKSANPEEIVAYNDPITYAKEINADIIILTDPDADRIGVAVKNDKNEYEVLNGNQVAVVTLKYILDNLVDIKNGYVFMSNVTTDLVKVIAESYNLKVVETLPGFKNIAEQIDLMPKGSTYVFGCEESNGSIVKEFVRDKDAVQGALMLAELASYTKQNGLTILDYLEDIYKEYNYFIEKTISYDFKGAEGQQKMNEVMDYLRNNKINFNNIELLAFEDYYNKTIIDFKNNKKSETKLPKSNILKFNFKNNIWIIARPSGTEPKLKIYYSVNNPKKDVAKEVFNILVNNFEQILNNI